MIIRCQTGSPGTVTAVCHESINRLYILKISLSFMCSALICCWQTVKITTKCFWFRECFSSGKQRHPALQIWKFANMLFHHNSYVTCGGGGGLFPTLVFSFIQAVACFTVMFLYPPVHPDLQSLWHTINSFLFYLPLNHPHPLPN